MKQLIISKQEIKDKINIFYAKNHNNNFYWIVKNEKEIFEIRSSDNEYIGMFDGNFEKYILSKEKEFNTDYKEYTLDTNVQFENFRTISISENLYETNYFQNRKMVYDINIDSVGNVTANVRYPDEKKGGYTFTLSKSDFNLFRKIINRFSTNKGGNEYFVDNDYCSQAIVMNNGFVLNDYSKMRSDVDVQAVIMFSNLLTMKYISKQKAMDISYKIKSSEYTKNYKPESL